MLAEVRHLPLNLCLAGKSFMNNVGLVLCEKSVLCIDIRKGLGKSFPLLRIVGGRLGHEHPGGDSVLVPDGRAGSVADGLFPAEDVGEAVFFHGRNGAADILEARQCLEHGHPVRLSDAVAKR